MSISGARAFGTLAFILTVSLAPSAILSASGSGAEKPKSDKVLNHIVQSGDTAGTVPVVSRVKLGAHDAVVGRLNPAGTIEEHRIVWGNHTVWGNSLVWGNTSVLDDACLVLEFCY
jgi:hypothetical protein